jgi:NAD(P)-dependent dehydrogenase (short-subunit alcohol dehydrogenase family)
MDESKQGEFLGVRDRFGKNEGILPFVGDVSKEDTATKVVEFAKNKFGRLDILVNNAASIVYKNTVEMTLDAWNSILQISATGVFLRSREALKAMIPQKSGRHRKHRIVRLFPNIPWNHCLLRGEGSHCANHSDPGS